MNVSSSGAHDDSARHGPERSSSPAAGMRQRFPWQLGVSVFAWVLLSGVLIASALGSTSTTSDADQGSVDAIQNSLGQSAVDTSGETGQHPTLYVLIGLVILVMALLLLVGQSWSQYALSGLAVIAVILCALGGQVWAASVTFVLLVVGALLLLNRPVQRYLHAR